MKWSQLLSLKFMDRFINNRYFLTAFWVLITSVVMGLIYFLANESFNSIELSLLDIRLRERAKHIAPSDDLVLVAMDRQTENYARNHPDLNIHSVALGRDRLAQLVEYLTREGAKAIIFDIEMKEPREGDERLARALKDAKNVYAATRMDVFLREEIAAQGASGEYSDAMFYYRMYLYPFIQYQIQLRQKFFGSSYVGLSDLYLGPFAPVPEIFPLKIKDLARPLSYESMRNRIRLSLGQPAYVTSPITMGTPVSAPWKTMVKNSCINGRYQNTYLSNPEFLKMLSHQGESVILKAPLPEDVENEAVRCYTGPVVNQLMANLDGIGITSVPYEQDAFMRQVPMLYQGYKGHFYYYLGVQAAFDLQNIKEIHYTPQHVEAGGRKIHLVDKNFVLINWRNPGLLVQKILKDAAASGYKLTSDPAKQDAFIEEYLKNISADKNNLVLGNGHLYRTVSAIDIIRTIEKHRLKEEAPPTLYNIPYYPDSGKFSFKDKIVMIGNTTTDIHRTPVGKTTYGPEILMTIMDMFLHDKNFVHKPDPLWLIGIIGVLAVVIVSVLIFFESMVVGFTIGVLLVIVYWLFNFHIFNSMALWFDLVTPTLCLGMALAGGTLYRYYIHDKEKHHLTDVFSKYVSPQIMDKILLDPEKAMDNLRGGKKELTVLFSDLQGFTHQFENADPEMMVAQLNEYFDVMTEIILQHGGTYDKYMGDSIMAFFGAPTDVPNHAEMACRAAIEMMKALRYLNDGWRLERKQPLSHGIGISTGEMFVGNFGSKNIKNFTVMGSNVNLGARLEAYTRVAQWPVIISERTRELTKTIAKVRDLGKVQVKGFREPVQVYGLEKMVELKGNVSLWKPSSPELQRKMGQQ